MRSVRIMHKMPIPHEAGSISSAPTPSDVLSWCAKADASGWFPAVHAQTTGILRDQLYEPTNALVRLGFIEVFDWVRGRGQGYKLTELGREKVGKPVVVPAAKPPQRSTGLTTYERGEIARDALIQPQQATITPALVVILSFWYLIGFFLAMNRGTSYAYVGMSDLETILRIGAAYGPRLAAGEWWRLATCCFVHIGIIHLLLNCYGLSLVGTTSEGMWGRWKFLTIFLVSAVAGSALATALTPQAVLAGASGGIWGVLLSIVAWLMLHRQHFERATIREIGGPLAFAVVVNAAASAIPGVAWQAHLAGGVAGFLTAWLLHSVRPGAGWRGRIAIGVLFFAILTGAAAYRYVVIRGTAWDPIWKFELARREMIERNGLNAQVEPANLKAALIPFSRIQQIHQDGTIAATAGSKKRLVSVRIEAGKLKADADAAREAFETMPVQGRDMERMLRAVDYFHRVSAYASEMEVAASGTPSPKTWTGLGVKLQELKSQFLALTAASTP